MAGIYLHIPFCRRKCVYCDFYSVATLDRVDDLHRMLLCELEQGRGFLEQGRSFLGQGRADKPDEIDTIYIGGGTPSLLSPGKLGELVDAVRRIWDGSDPAEITVEVNPDDLSLGYLKALRGAGFNRLSIGVQSFDDAQLKFMGRRHTAAASLAAVGDARAAGFDNISIDLIYGLPGMGVEQWRQAVCTALSLGVEHVSAYHLSIEQGTLLHRRLREGKFSQVDDSVSTAHYMVLHQMMTEAGYEHYEISNFAKPGCRSKHNSSYWSGTHYLGVGPSAHSFNGVQRRWCAQSVAEYLRGVEHQSETLTPTDAYNEYVMTSLRTATGVDCRVLERLSGERMVQYFMDSAAPMLADGSLVEQGDHVVIPYGNWLVSDAIICRLFDNN